MDFLNDEGVYGHSWPVKTSQLIVLLEGVSDIFSASAKKQLYFYTKKVSHRLVGSRQCLLH